MTLRLVLNLRQVADHIVRGSIVTITSLGNIPEPVFATNLVWGNIGTPLWGIDDDDLIDEHHDAQDNGEEGPAFAFGITGYFISRLVNFILTFVIDSNHSID
jgi:hypothetical protein